MNSVFSEQILADKLAKLNSTQQCIETLSHWCIFHRSKAEVVVATWRNQFHNSQMAQKTHLLYLANDILQNSKRKGNEFVTEFWKVLPAALKDVNNMGDDQGKKVVSRLVTIWEERRVFGSKPQKLVDIMLGDEAPPPLEFNKKRSRTVKIVRRDSRSIRTKLSIGGSAEKIVSAFHVVLNDHPTEEVEMNKCKSAVNRVRKMDHDVEIACAQVKDPKRKTLAKQLEEEEKILKECIEKLKSAETNRVALVRRLKEALQEQESELENIRTQMQVAQAQAEEANNMRKRLTDENYVAAKKTAADIAAEVADKLAASSSSQLIMSSVLSSFAAEALAKTSSTSTSYPPTPARSASNTIATPDQPTSVSDPNSHASTMPAHQYQAMAVNQPSMQNVSPSTQYPQTPTPLAVAAHGYGMLAPGPPVPPPLPHVVGPMTPMGQAHLQMNQPQVTPMAQQSMMMMQQQQPPPGAPSFRPLQPPGMRYYTHPHQFQ
ncbi:hypothetical protein RND81_13G204200 [Saponaria officinalis]|uniref:CID domain-containing protein n=1 Tax=Saponaria officinalis TaxID=3572 RepID=A0AAW1H061_SAPOF